MKNRELFIRLNRIFECNVIGWSYSQTGLDESAWISRRICFGYDKFVISELAGHLKQELETKCISVSFRFKQEPYFM